MAKFGYTKVPLAYMVAMVMCIITITAPWLQLPLAAAQQFTSSADAREFLQAHNQLRATARVANLVWNDSLAAVAKSFVEQQCASLAPCSSSSAQGAPAYSSGQNSWCIIVANANPQPTSASQTVATSSRWVTSRFPSYDDHHRHCHEEEGDGEEGDGEEGDGSSSTGAASAGPVARPAPGPLGSASAPVPIGSGFARAPIRSRGSITDPPMPLVRPRRGIPPSQHYDASGNTGTDASPTPGSGSGSGGGGVDASPTPGSGSGSGGIDASPTPGSGSGSGGGGVGASPTPAPLIVPGSTGSSNDGEEGDGEEEHHHHHCHREEDGEGDGEEGDGEEGGNAAQYFAQMVDSKTVSTGCYSLQCTANGVSYAACDYFPALPEIPTPPPTTSTKVRGLNL